MPAWLIKGVGLHFILGLILGITIIAVLGEELEPDGVWFALFLSILFTTLVGEVWRRVARARNQDITDKDDQA